MEKLIWEDSYTYNLEEEGFEKEEFKVEFKAEGTYWQKNDANKEILVTQVTIKSIKLNGIVLDGDDFTPWQIDDMQEKIADAIYDGKYKTK